MEGSSPTGLWPFFQPLFTQVPRRGFLGSSGPIGGLSLEGVLRSWVPKDEPGEHGYQLSHAPHSQSTAVSCAVPSAAWSPEQKSPSRGGSLKTL
jgi:hypothetical protein